jgi:hypothetical protein
MHRWPFYSAPCVSAMRSLLTSGNVEKQLKFLLLQGVHDDENLWYVMDKCININAFQLYENLPEGIRKRTKDGDYAVIGNHEIDLIAFEGCSISFVAETKCSFVCDVGGSIKDAIKKAKITQFLSFNQDATPWDEIKKSAQYIVHFLLLADPRRLNQCEQQGRKLEWLYSKYPHKTNYTPASGQEMVNNIIQMYKHNVDGKVNHVQVIPNELDVILVELQGKEVSVSY